MQFDLDEALEVLSTTPAVLTALLKGKSSVWLNARKSSEAFSAIDVLGHLIFAEMTDWIPRIRILLDHGEAQAFEPFDRFGFKPLFDGKSIDELLDEFTSQRKTGLEILRAMKLTDAQLALNGRHPEFGPVTLSELIAAWVVHDLGHINQIVKTMACEYRDAVGPWYAYTTILH